MSPLKKRSPNTGSGDKARASEGEWCLSIISEASDGRTVMANVEGFREYLRNNPPQAPTVLSTDVEDGGEVPRVHRVAVEPLGRVVSGERTRRQ